MTATASSDPLKRKIVVKIGGAALEDCASRQHCAIGIAQLAQAGHSVAVVHGGGSRLTRTLEQFGKKSSFVGGLRVTDAETRDVALMVLAGLVNKQLVQAIHREGRLAVGLCGGDGGSFMARKWMPEVVGEGVGETMPTTADLGFVGEIIRTDTRWLHSIWRGAAVPVLSSIALGTDGEYYNVNADAMASTCAVACGVETLIFLTDVPGVRAADGNILPLLSLRDLPGMVDSGVVSGGMLPKLQACAAALGGGVKQVHIAPAQQAKHLAQWLASAPNCGTEVAL